MKALDKRGLMDKTLIVFCADHGQEFGQHGHIGHCLDMYHDETHVPLIIVGGGMPAGVRAPTFVRNLDIMPTIEQYIEFYPKCEGESLFPVALGAAKGTHAADRQVFSCSDYASADVMMKMIISPQRMKYIVTENKTGGVIKEELFDLTSDADERVDLAGEEPEEIAAMRDRLKEVYLHKRSAAVPVSGAAPSASPLVQERLRSLGYLH
jgi:arylsulfatase A-like enzyme